VFPQPARRRCYSYAKRRKTNEHWASVSTAFTDFTSDTREIKHLHDFFQILQKQNKKYLLNFRFSFPAYADSYLKQHL
jgi:hypothetical protein